MELLEFLKTTEKHEPPNELNDHLKALWYDKKGKWEMAHSIVQILGDSKADLIHAYLHRKEGDSYNASYWYRKANKSKPDISLDEEWEILTNGFLRNN